MSTYKKDEELLPFSYQPYQKSDSVKQAEALLKQHTANRPAAYQSQYKGEMDNLRSQIENRKPFQYDVNGDALYNQYKDRYIHNGQRAMMDTMGQAAALTGGYGSSYAQNVGQQAYNEYMTGLNDVIPELYQLALDRYDQEGDALKDRYAMYADLDAQGYSRWQDGQSAYYSQLDRLTENARYEQEQDWSKYAAGYDAAYAEYEKAVKAAEERAASGAAVKPSSYSNYYDYLGAQAGSGKYLLDPDDEDAGYIEYNNGSVSNGNIMAMQRALGLDDTGMWSKTEKELTKMTANQAYDEYQKGTLQNWRSLSREPIGQETNTRGFTGSTYEEAVAYMQSNGVSNSAANVMTRNEWVRRRAAYETYGEGGAEVKNYNTYQEYLADYVEYAIENRSSGRTSNSGGGGKF